MMHYLNTDSEEVLVKFLGAVSKQKCATLRPSLLQLVHSKLRPMKTATKSVS